MRNNLNQAINDLKPMQRKVVMAQVEKYGETAICKPTLNEHEWRRHNWIGDLAIKILRKNGLILGHRVRMGAYGTKTICVDVCGYSPDRIKTLFSRIERTVELTPPDAKD